MATKFSCGKIKLSPFDATEKVHKTFTTEYVAYKPLQRKGRSQHWKNHPPSKLMRSRWIVLPMTAICPLPKNKMKTYSNLSRKVGKF